MRRRGIACIVAVALSAGACSSGSRPTGRTKTSTRSAVTLVTLNVLHGAICDDGDRHCDVTHRMDLLARSIEAARCPDVVALQEIAPWWHDLLVARVPTLCGGRYHLVFPDIAGGYLDVEAVLARVPTADAARQTLAAGLRRALYVRVTTRAGPVDLVVTHAGTGADDLGNGGADCGESSATCPQPCDPTASVFACQLVQLRALGDAHRDTTHIATIIAGDLNLVASAPILRTLFDAGYVDTYRAAGHPECDAPTGTGCTSGRDDAHVATLRDPNARDNVRVDYVLLRPTDRCRPTYGKATGLFAAAPAAEGREGPGRLAWISDHTGVELELSCE